jgi:hypothetical protein
MAMVPTGKAMRHAMRMRSHAIAVGHIHSDK